MSEFGTFLENESERQRRTAKAMAQDMGVPASMLSQFTSGEKQTCRPDSLMKIVSGISDEPAIQAALLQAYFRDQCTSQYKSWIRVTAPVNDGVARDEEPTNYGEPISQHMLALRKLQLPNAIVRALTFIARAIPGRQKFRVVIEDLGTFANEELLGAESKKRKK
jgi:hypothetical protein